MKALLFTATVFSGHIESAIEMPGYSHFGPEQATRVLWYPFVEQTRKVFFFAVNRRSAAKQLDRHAGLARDLSEGKRCDGLISDSIRKALSI